MIHINLADYMPQKHRFRMASAEGGNIIFMCVKCPRYISLDRHTWVAMLMFNHKPDYSVVPEGWTDCRPRKESK